MFWQMEFNREHGKTRFSRWQRLRTKVQETLLAHSIQSAFLALAFKTFHQLFLKLYATEAFIYNLQCLCLSYDSPTTGFFLHSPPMSLLGSPCQWNPWNTFIGQQRLQGKMYLREEKSLNRGFTGFAKGCRRKWKILLSWMLAIVKKTSLHWNDT